MPAVSSPTCWTAEMVSPLDVELDDGMIVHPVSRLVERWCRGAPAPVLDLPALFDAIPEQFRTP